MEFRIIIINIRNTATEFLLSSYLGPCFTKTDTTSNLKGFIYQYKPGKIAKDLSALEQDAKI